MKKQLLIVMDLGSFKAYTVDNSPLNTTPRLELIEHFTPEEPHRKIADKLSDLAGRYRAPGAKGGSPWGDRHNLELEERKRLVRQLARRLNALMGGRDVDFCCFAASREINQQILDALSPAAQAKIKRRLTADLVKASKETLLGCFGLRPKKRTGPATRLPASRARPYPPPL